LDTQVAKTSKFFTSAQPNDIFVELLSFLRSEKANDPTFDEENWKLKFFYDDPVDAVNPLKITVEI